MIRTSVSEKSVSIGNRLVEERKRLKIKQVALIAKTGISKTTQVAYESNRRHPNADYLVELHKLGFDVLYILTGLITRSAPIATAHKSLIDAFDAAPRILKTAALAVLFSHILHEHKS